MERTWSFSGTNHTVNPDDLDRAFTAISLMIPSTFCTNPIFHPDGYNDIVSCVFDAVGSVGVRYSAVINGLNRYRSWCDDNDVVRPQSPKQFLETFTNHLDDHGAWFAQNLWNYQRTSTRSGILKTLAMQQVLQVLASAGLETTTDLLANINNQKVRNELRSVRGQSDGVSIVYLFMLAGYRDGVKDDRMIGRYFERLLGKRLTTPEKAVLMMTLADKFRDKFPCIDAHMIDHLLWLVESGRYAP